MSDIPDFNLSLNGKIWYYAFSWKGIRYRGTTKKKQKTAAYEYAKDVFFKNIGEERKSIYKNQYQLFDEYMEYIRKKGRSEATIDNYDRYLDRFRNMFRDKHITEIDREDMQKWVDYLSQEDVGSLRETQVTKTQVFVPAKCEVIKKPKGRKKLSIKTINEHINFVSAVYKFHGLESPCKHLIRPKSQKEQVEEFKAYSTEEVKTILREAKKEHEGKRLRNMRRDAHEYFYHWVTLYAYTGARLGELQFLQYRHIDNSSQTVLILSEKTKKYRRLNFSDPKMWNALQAAETLAKKHYRRPLQPEDNLQYKYANFFYKHFKNFCKRHKVEWKGDHGLRHAYASHALLNLGISIDVLAKHLGHDRNTCFRTYSHLMGAKTHNFSWGEDE